MSLPKVNIYDFLRIYPQGVKSNNLLVNIRGTNGAGKSTIPLSFLAADESSFELVYFIDNHERVLATVFPQLGWLSLGSYRTKCGGLDSYKTTEQTFDSLDLVWELDFNIIMEGVISSTIRSTYIELFTNVNQKHVSQRKITVATLLPPFKVCLERIQSRNGGKPVKSEQVQSKYNTVKNNVSHFRDAGINSIVLDNSSIALEDTLSWFLSEVSSKQPKMMPKQSLSSGKESITKANKGGLLIAERAQISDYEWFPYYREPNSRVSIDEPSFKQFWYWIHERQEIWDKRVNQELLAPWTNDKILRDYKFTHACRDLDRLSIFYIKNILMRLEDTEQSKKEVILNTMIYRLFCRLETWEMFGYLKLDNWEKDWARAKAALRKRKASGQPVFTDAYFVFGLHTVSPDPNVHDKTENAINLIAIWHSQLDEIYENVVNSDGMNECLTYLQTLPCVGNFNAYEFACDFAWCHQYTDVKLVNWTIDNYTNAGPGAKAGLSYIFKNRGNLSEVEAIIYLRSIAKMAMEKYGYGDVKLPPEIPELNMRCIEHSLCEYSKYRRAYDGTGRPRVKFTQKTKDTEQLKL